MLTFRALTANCGNGTPGAAAAQSLQAAIENVDITFIFCQEADFKKTREELEAQLPKTLTITPIHKMVTHTQGKTQLHARTGIMILAIHHSAVEIKKNQENQQKIRRGGRISGSAYNKGGVFSHLVVEKGSEKFTLDLTSAHLDSAKEETRALDWANIHQAQRYEATSYDELCRKLPDTVISGFDANTRNQLRNNGSSTNSWKKGKSIPAMQSLIMAPLGNHRLSRDSTYKTGMPNVLNEPDKKRPRYAKGGMLDLVCYNEPKAARKSQSAAIEHAPFYEPVVDGESRDHAIIGSGEVRLKKSSDFDKVRNYIGCALTIAAPELAAHILSSELQDTKENRSYLFEIHQLYLSPEGLLQKKLYDHAANLEFLNNELQAHAHPDDEQKIVSHLFPETPWFSFPDTNIPLTVKDLTTHKKLMNHLLALDDRRQWCLANPFSLSEKMLMIVVLSNAKAALMKASPTQQGLIIQQTEKLIKAIQIIWDYNEHLEQENTEPDALYNQKVGVVENLIKTLQNRESPHAIIQNLNSIIRESEKTLATHRDDDLFSRMIRCLKSLFSPRLSETHGAFFAQEISDLIKQETIKPETGLDESNSKDELSGPI